MSWDIVIGLEVHVQLSTRSKLFSGSSTQFGGEPNAQTSFIDAGLPGVLPVLNKEAVNKALLFGLAIGAKINPITFFERKNYFYPDLPKGYQISQNVLPIVGNGQLHITLNGEVKAIDIERAHLEEDAGKSLHEQHDFNTGIDLNRAGTPLLEIVTTPCLTSAEEAVTYLKTLHQLVRFIGICDGNMQEGSFRCDVNISLKPQGQTELGTRVELKNLNSFRFIEKAIQYEVLRQAELLEGGRIIKQETRLYDPAKDQTVLMRDKENVADYRYFPDPDLLPIIVTESLLKQISSLLPKLPNQLKEELNHQLIEEDINFLLGSKEVYCYFEQVQMNTKASAKLIVNWMKGALTTFLNSINDRSGVRIERSPISPQTLANLLDYLADNRISNTIAKQIFQQLCDQNGTVEEIITAGRFLEQDDNEVLEQIIISLINQHPLQVKQYQEGKTKVMGFFVGQVMKTLKGQCNPELVQTLIHKKIMTA